MNVNFKFNHYHGFCAYLIAFFCAFSTTALQAKTDISKHFLVSAPGVIKDTRTGLEWMRCSLGQEWKESTKTCTGEVKKFSWQGAQDAATKQNSTGGFAGRTGWRVPSVHELQGIRYCSKGYKSEKINLPEGKGSVPSLCVTSSTTPAIDTVAFPATPDTWFWTSSTQSSDASIASGAWFVHFSNGATNYSAYRVVYLGAVRLVR